MNTSQKKITGMIAVFDNAALNARLDYEIDLARNKVVYLMSYYWKARRIYGKSSFDDYKDAKVIWEGLPAVAEQELKQTA